MKRQEAEIQGFLHSAEASLRYGWFQSLRLPSTQSERPLAPKSHVSFKAMVFNLGSAKTSYGKSKKNIS
jgi:hypothetical protein